MVRPGDEDATRLRVFGEVVEADLQQLIERSIDAEHIRFAIFNGPSDNRFKRLDISDARLPGYAPQDDLTDMHPRLKELHLGEQVSAHNVQDERQDSGAREGGSG
ncbi:MAG TPA: hypothetical protein VNL77_25545 [Roseiflexaceae bacterium]|nr:hypothetical protein [Roseiflexaceae bacterium]